MGTQPGEVERCGRDRRIAAAGDHHLVAVPVDDVGVAVAGIRRHRDAAQFRRVRGHDVGEVLERPGAPRDLLDGQVGRGDLAGRVQEHLGAADGVRACDLRIEDLLGRDRGEAADHRVGDREDALEAVDVEVSVPDIVRRRREDRDQPAVGQDTRARGIEHPAGLEIETGEMPVGLIAVAGQEHAVPLRERGQGFVFGAIRRDRALGGPLRDGLAPRRAGQDVLRKHDELELGPDPASRALERLVDAQQRGLHPARRRCPVVVGMDTVAVDLQGERGITVETLRHVAPPAKRSSARSLQVSRPVIRPWATWNRSHQRAPPNSTPSANAPLAVPRT